MRYRVLGFEESGVRSQDSGFRSQDSGFRIRDSGVKILVYLMRLGNAIFFHLHKYTQSQTSEPSILDVFVLP
ncbi:unknown protein [Microcystis aeruginosa NIES-843]|uniref:Uncharacterized protein n=1 Tax=Microcystis aeruginosa (strain NIES-843 / IAM M-2473) TaxID=449447 RepID=B0JQI4_MICAN|nr:unknown protein [Microcystis aeruginosa NIES-843]